MAIFAIFEYTENIKLKSDQNFCKIIVPTRILIEYSIMFTERIALASALPSQNCCNEALNR